MKYLKEISNYNGNIDLIKSCAKSATMYGYTRPIFCDSLNNSKQNENSGYVNATDLRHPIIERLHNNIGYVPNDAVGNNDKVKMNKAYMVCFYLVQMRQVKVV